MTEYFRLYIVFALLLLICTLCFGIVASWAFLYPETYNNTLPFYQLRPFHVSSALFWIITGATASISFYKNEVFQKQIKTKGLENIFLATWIIVILTIFGCYAFKQFGGREYWEFPPILCVPLLCIWIIFALSYFIPMWRSTGSKPLYVWMWSTGILFFLITFIEQNLWQIPWFRYSFLREMTVQWKANGATVGAWNQMIYGTALYMMVKISGDESIAKSKQAFFFYFLGLSNLMFNWGHHIYNVPGAAWIRNVSYVISMTEVLFLLNIIRGFKKKLVEREKLRHLIPYRFLIAAEFWVFANLFVVLLISIPAVNRYTHGTHITVAHSMIATIGINTMILLGSFAYILNVDEQNEKIKKRIQIGYWIGQWSLGLLGTSLLIAGTIKGYRETYLKMTSFQEIMHPAMPFLKLFSFSGIGLLVGLGLIAFSFIYCTCSQKRNMD